MRFSKVLRQGRALFTSVTGWLANHNLLGMCCKSPSHLFGMIYLLAWKFQHFRITGVSMETLFSWLAAEPMVMCVLAKISAVFALG